MPGADLPADKFPPGILIPRTPPTLSPTPQNEVLVHGARNYLVSGAVAPPRIDLKMGKNLTERIYPSISPPVGLYSPPRKLQFCGLFSPKQKTASYLNYLVRREMVFLELVQV